MSLVRALLGRRPPKAQFVGAQTSRLTHDWILAYSSVDQEIRSNLALLRARARDLVRNASWAGKYTKHLANNVVGHMGIRLQSRIERPNGLPLEVANDRHEEAWRAWGDAEQCSADGRLSWLDAQRLAVRSAATDGEALLWMVPGFDNAFGFALQQLDPDQLDETLNTTRRADGTGPEIRMGIEVDPWGRPIAYHVWASHPAEPGGRRERRRIPASQVIHLVDPYRVGQSRGVSWFASVMLELNMLRGYFEAELVAARVAAAKGGFFTSDEGVGEEANDTTAANALRMEAEAGVFDKLPDGWDFKPWTPEHPVSAFPEFTKAMLRAISAGLGVSYASLANDLTDVNYSSIRAGILDERDTYRGLQQWMIQHCHRRVHRAWVPAAILAGKLDPRLKPEAYEQIEWQPRGWPWVDPESDINAAIKAVQWGFNSRRRMVGEQGYDVEEVLRDLAEENRLADVHGVPLGEPQGAAQAEPSRAKRRQELEDLEATGGKLRVLGARR